MLGLDNLMFSVDYPFQDNFAAMEFLHRCDLSAADKVRFAYRTAENLLGVSVTCYTPPPLPPPPPASARPGTDCGHAHNRSLAAP